ncbi:MAG TPA: VOC family protein [Myxococcales bacterium]|jgi:catechol 2,3-dioxygenase-like lactoylglutathione lyase family enzyme|nr:VOC family protein [Myxococcales bacterium]
MIDHMTLTVRDLKASIGFYQRVLKPLGYRVKMDFKEFVGFGDDRKPYFWLKSGPTPTQPMHIAFSAGTRAMVDAFHQAALDAGARDDGSPGLREDYHPHYYGAFVIDPDGHPIEAVCHLPHRAPRKAAPKAKARAKRR